jgi:hypothetical protein
MILNSLNQAVINIEVNINNQNMVVKIHIWNLFKFDYLIKNEVNFCFNKTLYKYLKLNFNKIEIAELKRFSKCQF